MDLELRNASGRHARSRMHASSSRIPVQAGRRYSCTARSRMRAIRGMAATIKRIKNGRSLRQLVCRWALCAPLAAPAASRCLNVGHFVVMIESCDKSLVGQKRGSAERMRKQLGTEWKHGQDSDGEMNTTVSSLPVLPRLIFFSCLVASSWFVAQ